MGARTAQQNRRPTPAWCVPRQDGAFVHCVVADGSVHRLLAEALGPLPPHRLPGAWHPAQ